MIVPANDDDSSASSSDSNDPPVDEGDFGFSKDDAPPDEEEINPKVWLP
jgi:hypothetical protein